MNKTEIMNNLTRTFYKTGLKIKKHSPEILLVAGVAGIVTSGVMACKATLKVNEIVDGAKKQIDTIHDVAEDPDMNGKYSEDDAKKAIGYYREYYSKTGIFQNRIYDGIKELLSDLKKSGKKLIVATSKPEHFAKIVLECFDITKYFDYIAGASMDESSSEKAEIMEYAIKTCNIDASKAVMIGDRHFDIDGAKLFGMDSIGVLFGYGTKIELEEAGATYIADSADEIRKILL